MHDSYDGYRGTTVKYEGNKEDSVFYRLSKIPMPEESFGSCKRASACGNWKVVLGNGYCVTCWDRGLDKGIRKSKKRMEEEGVEEVKDIQPKPLSVSVKRQIEFLHYGK